MKIGHLITLTLCILPLCLNAQEDNREKKDSSSAFYQYIPEISIIHNEQHRDVVDLPEVVGTDIFAGKKNALLIMDKVPANVLTNNMREVMAKVPGIHVWESDGSGIQIGVATRGLSPNRTIEFNVRQNGNEIAADPISYSEAYYNPQLQGVQKIQIVRGAASLQYGTQFGGMINYIMKNGYDIQKPFEFETQQSMGSFGLYNAFNAVGGTIGKFHYYAFVDYRKADGWRQNSRYDIKNYFVNTSYQCTNNLKIMLEYTQQNMLSQQPGGLTDKMFEDNVQQSFRNRNWFQINWHIIAANLQWNWHKNSLLSIKTYYLTATRNSIGYQVGDMTIADTINHSTLQYNARAIEFQGYDNIGCEIRNRTNLEINHWYKNILSVGIKYYQGTSPYKTSTNGSTKDDRNFDILDNIIANHYDRHTKNVAAFFENAFLLGKNLIITPGLRYENIKTSVSGKQNGYAIINATPERNIFLLGISVQYRLPFNVEIYSNYTEAFKPFFYGNISQLSTNKIDPNLKDANGYNADLGIRGYVKRYIHFDMSGFYLHYNNRFGTITQTDNSTFATNVGHSTHYGFEGLLEIDILKFFVPQSDLSINLFSSYSYVHATYDNFITSDEKNLKGNRVQDAPKNIMRNGITFSYNNWVLQAQHSLIDEVFSDANNTREANIKGTVGIIPSYNIVDINLSGKLLQNYSIKVGINNVFDTRYFTRRASSFPGSGIMPGEARSLYVTLCAKF